MARCGRMVVLFLVLVATPSSWGSTRVGVVNVPLVSERYQKTADLEAKFEALRVELSNKRSALQQQIERGAQSLREEFKPGTNEFAAQQKKVAMLEAEMQWFIDSEGKNVERGLASSLREIFDDIQAVVGKVAAERSIQVVVAADQLPTDDPESPTQVRQQILLQKVLYWSPDVDITQAVIDRLNNEYRESLKKTSRAAPADHGVKMARAFPAPD